MSYYSMRDVMQVIRDSKFKESKDALPYVVNKGNKEREEKTMKLLLYCTKAKPYLIGRNTDKYYLDKGGQYSIMDSRDFIHNGKIVAECDFEVEEIKYHSSTKKNTHYEWFEFKGLNVGNEDC